MNPWMWLLFVLASALVLFIVIVLTAGAVKAVRDAAAKPTRMYSAGRAVPFPNDTDLLYDPAAARDGAAASAHRSSVSIGTVYVDPLAKAKAKVSAESVQDIADQVERRARGRLANDDRSDASDQG